MKEPPIPDALKAEFYQNYGEIHIVRLLFKIWKFSSHFIKPRLCEHQNWQRHHKEKKKDYNINILFRNRHKILNKTLTIKSKK